MSGGFDVRKCSAKPSKEIYQASCVDAILTFLIGGNGVVNSTVQNPTTVKNSIPVCMNGRKVFKMM